MRYVPGTRLEKKGASVTKPAVASPGGKVEEAKLEQQEGRVPRHPLPPRSGTLTGLVSSGQGSDSGHPRCRSQEWSLRNRTRQRP